MDRAIVVRWLFSRSGSMGTVQDTEGHSSRLGFLPGVRSVRVVERINDAPRNAFPPIVIHVRAVCSRLAAVPGWSTLVRHETPGRGVDRHLPSKNSPLGVSRAPRRSRRTRSHRPVELAPVSGHTCLTQRRLPQVARYAGVPPREGRTDVSSRYLPALERNNEDSGTSCGDGHQSVAAHLVARPVVRRLVARIRNHPALGGRQCVRGT